MKVRTTVVVLLCVLILCPLAAQAPDTGSKPGKSEAAAAKLIREAQRAVGQVVKVAREDAALRPDTADAKPFWEAMKDLNESLDKADTGLTLKDKTFFSSLATAGAAVQQAEIAVTMSDSRNAGLDKAMETLSKIVGALDKNYSKEASRLAQGSKLTAKERQQLAQLKAKQDELDKNLKDVRKMSGKNSKKIQEGTQKIYEMSKSIRNADYDAAGFYAAMTAARFMSGMIWGWHWWWGPWGYWGPGFVHGGIIAIWDVWIIDCPYDWGLTELAIDVAYLELAEIEFDLEELEDVEDWLEADEFTLDTEEFEELSDDLAVGWDDIEFDGGDDMMEGMVEDFDEMPFEAEADWNTFDDVGMDDFGGFDDMDFDDFDFD